VQPPNEVCHNKQLVVVRNLKLFPL